MKSKRLVIYLVFLFGNFTLSVFSQQKDKYVDKTNVALTSEVSMESTIISVERTLLHVANNVFENGIVFFNGNVLTAPTKNLNLSAFVIVELLDKNGNSIKRQFHKILDGAFSGSMSVSNDLPEGVYNLRVYTNYMRNFSKKMYASQNVVMLKTKDFKLDSTDQKPIIIVEGLRSVSGIENNLIVKFALGSPALSGEVIDDQDKAVAKLKKYDDGISIVKFTPLKERKYHLLLSNGASYPVPESEENGAVLRVNNLSDKKLIVNVKALPSETNRNLKLVGSIGGVKYLEIPVVFKNDWNKTLEVSKTDLPDGIFILELLDNLDNTISRRPVLIDNKDIRLNIESEYTTDGEVELKIKVIDKLANGMVHFLALNVFDTNFAQDESSIDYHEANDFRLFSQIEPGQFGKNDELRKTWFLRDLHVQFYDTMLLTGSSQPSYLNNTKIRYPYKKGLELKGYAYDLDNNLLANKKIQIMVFSSDNQFVKEVTTGSDGFLSILDIDVSGNAQLVFRTTGETTESRLVKFMPLEDFENETYFDSLLTEPPIVKDSLIDEELTSKVINKTEGEIYNGNNKAGLIALEEVIVKDEYKTKGKEASTYGVKPSSPQRIKYQDPRRLKSLPQLLSEIPGVIVSGIGGLNPNLTILRGTGSVLFVIDGLALSQSSSTTGSDGTSYGGGNQSVSLSEIQSVVQHSDIERIELLIGNDAGIYGTRAAGGVVQIYTRQGSENNYISRKQAQIEFQGYSNEIDYNSYLESLSKKKLKELNLLYWNPKIQTDTNEEVSIRFKLPMNIKNIAIEAVMVSPQDDIELFSRESSLRQ